MFLSLQKENGFACFEINVPVKRNLLIYLLICLCGSYSFWFKLPLGVEGRTDKHIQWWNHL